MYITYIYNYMYITINIYIYYTHKYSLHRVLKSTNSDIVDRRCWALQTNKLLTEAPLPPSPLACLAGAAHGPRTCRAEHRSEGAAAKLAGMMGVQGMHGFSVKKWVKTMSF